jgi:processive 1,2-diacylglycerol beta-glucosyltransferase
LPSEIAAHLKKQGRLTSKLITVITDFGVHPFWVCEGTDVYAVATDFTKRQLVLAGGKEECVKESGIPINPGFLKHYDKGAVRKALGLEQNKFTVLVITGSFGIGDIERIVELLHKDVQVLVVCARNLTLYKRLKNRNYPEVEVFGFVNNIPELMAASEVVITKPGGLTISELLAMELVPVFISEIPGQETTNANILEEYGVGIRVKKIEDLKDIILNFKENPERLNRLKENIRKIKKPFAVEELYNVVCQGSVGNTCRGVV